MQCPVCEEELALRSYADLKLDQCGTCGGVWCDRGELQPMVHALLKTGNIPAKGASTLHAARQEVDTDDRTKPCPRCQQMTESFNFAYDSNIYLNRCLACEGIWLDGGELRQVAAFIRKNSFEDS